LDEAPHNRCFVRFRQDCGQSADSVHSPAVNPETPPEPLFPEFLHLHKDMQVGQYGKKLLLALVMCVAPASNAQTKPGAQHPETVAVEMQNVMYRFTEQIAVHIFNLQGKLVSTKPNEIPVFDDNRSFLVAISSAEISISTKSMASVLNQYVFAARDAPLKNIEISIEDGKLKIKGKLHSKGDIPFESEGTLSVNGQGEIVVHTEKIKAAHLPVKGFMDVLGVEIADLINTNKIQGVRTEKDDIVLSPEQILPPPHIQGRLTDVQLKGDEIIQRFGKGEGSKAVRLQAGNFMSYRGAELRFGKLTMNDTDLVLMDMDQQDPFDFYLDHYKEQLAAGYTRITPEFGLRVYMPDFSKLRVRRRKQPQPGTRQP